MSRPDPPARGRWPFGLEVVTDMHDDPDGPEDIDSLFDAAAAESLALNDLEAAVAMLRAATEAKIRLQRLDAGELRAHLERRAGEAS